MAGDQQLDQGIGMAVDDDGDELPEETLKEMAAVAEAVATTTEVEQAAEAERLAAVERELEAQRAQTRASLGRYREALLAAEPALPPELVSGETLEELEESLAAARRAVAQIRERLSAESEADIRGFPVGAPERRGPSMEGMTSAEKIAYGLEQHARAG